MGNDSSATAAGLALSAYSTLHDLVQDIGFVYNRFKQSANAELASSSLLLQFACEKARLDEWCISMGYTVGADGNIRKGTHSRLSADIMARLQSGSGVSRMRISLARISEILKNVQAEFETLTVVDIKNMDEFINGVGASTSTAPEQRPQTGDVDAGVGQSIQSHQELVNLLRGAGLLTTKQTGLPTKISEAARGTFDKIQSHLDRLRDENEILESFLSRTQIDITNQLVVQKMVQVHETMDTMCATMRTLAHPAPRVQIATANWFLTVQPLTLIDTLDMREQMEIHEDDLEYSDGDEKGKQRRQLVKHEGFACLLEWNEDRDDQIAARQETEKRLANLALRLRWDQPDTYRIFSCMGYVTGDTHETFGLLYKLPEHFRPDKDQVTCLGAILSSAPVPPLGTRFELARRLTVALIQFQTCQWLHEGISSHNIVFLVRDGVSPALDMPYITGFDFSRHIGAGSEKRKAIAADGETAQQLVYVHPLRRQQQSPVGSSGGGAPMRFRGEFDVYAFGRVLLDIASWRLVAADHRSEDLKESIAKLPGLVGEIFTQVVRWCLGLETELGSSPICEDKIKGRDRISKRNTEQGRPPQQSQEAWPQWLSDAFNNNVLRPLYECKA